MAKTWQSVIDEARTILQDEQTPFRYTNIVLLAKLNRGVQELGRLRPDAFWDLFAGDDIIVPEIVNFDSDPDDNPDDADADEDGQIALTANFNLPMMFRGPLVYWLSASAELVDDEFTEDGRASILFNNFKQMVLAL